MNKLQQDLEAMIARVPWRMLVRRVGEKLEDHGIVLSAEDEEYLEEHFRTGMGLNEVIELPSNPETADITLSFTPEDERELVAQVDTFLEEKLPTLIEGLSDSL